MTEIPDSAVFLTSFPRSGNTWVRFLIANVYNGLKREFAEIDFHNIHDIVPEWKRNAVVAPYFCDLPFVVKTHQRCSNCMKKAILLLRDPGDVMCSYRDFLAANQGLSLSLDEIVRHDRYGIRALVAHADSYLKSRIERCVLTYEKLHDRPEEELKRLCDFIDLEVEEEIIAVAAGRSEFPVMREIEQRKSRKFGKKNFRFVRHGSVGEGRKAIRNQPDLARFIDDTLKSCETLNRLYG